MKEIVTDLIAEQDALDSFLCTLTDEQWELKTPADWWIVKDCVSHISYADEASIRFIKGDLSPLDEAEKCGERYGDMIAYKSRILKPAQVLEEWRTRRKIMDDLLMEIDPKTRLPWFAMPMGARAFATARLMEVYAHGLDCYDAVGVEPVVTDRLRHVAMLAWMVRPYAYSVNELEMPDATIRVELTLPSGKIWSQGPEDAKNIIRGTAKDFCRVAVRRGHWKDTSLEIVGSEANRFAEIAQTYAGPPGRGRAPKNQ